MTDETTIEASGLSLFLGIGVGLLTGALTTSFIQKKRFLSPNEVLKTIKRSFLKEGPIEGSWIEFHRIPLQKFAIKSEGYVGGITRIEDNEVVQYEFIADAMTGSVIEVNRLAN